MNNLKYAQPMAEECDLNSKQGAMDKGFAMAAKIEEVLAEEQHTIKAKDIGLQLEMTMDGTLHSLEIEGVTPEVCTRILAAFEKARKLSWDRREELTKETFYGN